MFQGLVVRWFGEKKFGFISYEHGGSSWRRSSADVPCAPIGRAGRAWATENAVVVFDLDGKQTEGQKRPAQQRTSHSGFVDNEEHESLETYREVSTVVDFNSAEWPGLLA